MPIRIPDRLPARQTLEKEGLHVLKEADANRQDIRPLQIGLLNLMPNKIRTETQLARLIGATPLQVDLTLVRLGSHKAKHTSEAHLVDFYSTWDEVKHRKFDAFIITGAPVETLPYEEVTYWPELVQIFDWTATHVHSTLFICWGAMAAAYHFHDVPKHTLQKKAFGVYRHQNLKPDSPYLRGFSDDFHIPVSRWTEVRSQEIRSNSKNDGLEVLMESSVTGPCLLHEKKCNRLYIFNHLEYDSTSLAEEYNRDIQNGTPIEIPHNYFPADNPQMPPLNRWRSHAYLLYGNWIDHVYQTTPHDMEKIGTTK